MTGVPAPAGWETRDDPNNPNATVWRLPGTGVAGAFVLEHRLTSNDYPHLGDHVCPATVSLRGFGPVTDPAFLHRAAQALHQAAVWLESQDPPPPPDGQLALDYLEEALRG